MALPRLWPMARARSQLEVTPIVQPPAFSQTLTLMSSVRFAAIRAAPPKTRGGRTALAGGGAILKKNGLGFAEPVDHAGSVKQRVQLVNDWLEAEGDFHAFSGSPGDRAGLGRPRNPKSFLKLSPHECKRSLNRGINADGIHGRLLSAPHMLGVRGKSSGM